MTLANEQGILPIRQGRLYREFSSVSRETPGASGEVARAIPVTMRRNVTRSCVYGGDC